MKKICASLLLLIILVLSFPSQVQTAAALPNASFTAAAADELLDEMDEPVEGAALCAPGASSGCIAGAPVIYQEEMQAKGIYLPYRGAEYVSLDPSWGVLPYQYGKVVTSNAPVYGSPEAASQQGPVLYNLENGFNYISYTFTDVINDVRVYMLGPGVWMNAIDVHRVGIPSFRGITFDQSPVNPFGWILQAVETRRTPGYQSNDLTGTSFNRLEIVDVYDITEVDGIEWVRIGPADWIETGYLAKVFPNRNPPEGVTGNRWIEINLFEQTVAAYEDGRLVFATITSTGVDPYWTRPGMFQVYQKLDTTKMTGAFAADRSDYYYLMDVPWTMYFDEARAIHGAYWHTFFGYPRSHGCVNLSPADSSWLYKWAEVGDWVYVHDPSGLTPVDAELYTDGGA